jgi:hypothetical protein
MKRSTDTGRSSATWPICTAPPVAADDSSPGMVVPLVARLHGGSVGSSRRILGTLDIWTTLSRIAIQTIHQALVMERSRSGGQPMHTPMMALVGTVSRV